MMKGTPERLTKWQVNGKLNIDHPAQEDIAWAADCIAELKTENQRFRDALAAIVDGTFEEWEMAGVAMTALNGGGE